MKDYIITVPDDGRHYEIYTPVDDGVHEVVRCQDCDFFAVDELGEVCDQFDFSVAGGKMRDGFCAWGKPWGWDEEE